ncbi:Cysteine-rich receptor-like protein kinase [Thalictrum thalictroides]|uniref:Cysteine-rich receptor-like protein kinase n=1 Tax=Thalictrum thalictroides TaxID=46969 RepID=A0A7J6WN79_THATH|nr:Cysteine-rich receptor-like protein kinase [Thalictrum thalictroides]
MGCKSVRAATENFSDANKLGEGGFGAVYKGELSDGQEIAVKRLSRNSGQGDEKLLIYEFLPNTSLDHFIFDPIKRTYLDWERRYKIIGGIARDFGMARLFAVDQTQGNTSRIVGTYGYMSPEYARYGHFSAKSDVFSFGVLVLEILTGQKNSSFYQSDNAQDLISYVWRHWEEGTALELIEPSLENRYSRTEVMRCIHIGLLCVQEDMERRPTMALVVLMLNSYSVTMPLPSKPAFFVSTFTGSYAEVNEMYTSSTSQSVVPAPSMSSSTHASINEMSITELYPR